MDPGAAIVDFAEVYDAYENPFVGLLGLIEEIFYEMRSRLILYPGENGVGVEK
jgi:hypothetical protein